MKLNVLFLFLSISSLACAQNKEIYLELNDQILINTKNAEMGVFEFTLRIRNPKNEDNDTYTFLANLDATKSFAENGSEIPAPKFITVADLKRKTPCKLHDYLSKSRICFVKIVNGKYMRWFAMYTGTYRNLLISNPGKI